MLFSDVVLGNNPCHFQFTGHSHDAAAIEVRFFIADFDMRPVAIGEEEAQIAVEAHARYAKGVHPARLNMGDCFAYACARTNDARLLYKGGDFSQTDIA